MNNKIIALLFVLAVLIPFSYSNWGLTESSEARYAEIGKEMFVSHDFLNPKILGINHYHKPPMTYYITALGYSIFGVNEYGARSFLQIALLLQLLFVFLIAQQLYNNKKVSLAATLIYFSYPIVQIAAKNLTTDAYLTTFIFVSIYFFIRYRLQDKIKFLYLFYFFCGLAFLTKGPVGVLPQMIFAIVYVKANRLKFRFGVNQWLGVVFFLLLSASWFLVLILSNKEFVSYFFEYQLVERVSGNTFKRSKPFWYYLAFMPALALPAILYFLDFILMRFNKNKQRIGFISGILLVPLAIMFLIFSLSSSKLVLYVLPLYLFIAIFSGVYISNISLQKIKNYSIVGFAFGLLLFGGIIAACFVNIPFSLPKIPLISIAVISLVIISVLYKQAKSSGSFVQLSLLNAAVIGLLVFALPVIMKANEIKINSIKPIAQYLNKQTDSKGVVVYDYLLPSLAFYLNRPVTTIHNNSFASARETYFTKNPAAKPYPYYDLQDSTGSIDFVKPELSQEYLLVPRKYPVPDSLHYLIPGKNYIPFEDQWKLYLPK